jgi:hypothetical protein
MTNESLFRYYLDTARKFRRHGWSREVVRDVLKRARECRPPKKR